jgi:hypothetical protein
MRLWQSRMCATFTVTVAPFSTRWHQTLKKRKTGKRVNLPGLDVEIEGDICDAALGSYLVFCTANID